LNQSEEVIRDTDDLPDLTAAAPQLNYSLGNPGAPGTIFVSSKASDNQLSLVMSSMVAASFTAGTLVPPHHATTGTGSLLYLDLTPLGLTDAEFNALKLTATGWTFALYSGASGQYVGFTPTGPVSLPPSPAAISLALGDFTMAAAPGSSASLSVLAYRVTGVTGGSFPVSGSMGVVFQAPDDNTGDLTAAIQVGLSPAQVVATNNLYPEVDNQLVLSLTQQPNQPTVNSGDSTVFTLNFVYSTDPNGYGALLTTAEGKAVAVTAAQGTTSWTITPTLDADLPNWTLTPPPDTALFGTGVDSTIAFAIANLVTQFQPGPTVVLIGYSGVPGYKNGSFAVTLTKEPHVLITSFAASHDQMPLGSDGTADVVLSWSTAYATQLTLIMGTSEKDVTGHTTWPVSLTDTTDFQLIASGSQPGGADNRAISQIVPVSVLPVINSFEITSAEPSGDPQAPVAVTLAWNVTTNAEFILIDEGNGSSQAYGPVAQYTFNTTPPAPITLTAKAGVAGPTVTATASFPPNCWAFLQITCPTDMISVEVGWNNLPSPQQTQIDILVERPAPFTPWTSNTQTIFNSGETFELSWSPGGSGTVTVVATPLGPDPLPANLSITASWSPA
jgi:hypothetical protein